MIGGWVTASAKAVVDRGRPSKKSNLFPAADMLLVIAMTNRIVSETLPHHAAD